MRGTTLKRRGATALGDLPGLWSPAGRTTAVRVALVLALAASLRRGAPPGALGRQRPRRPSADGRQDRRRGGRHVRQRVRTALRADRDGGARARGGQPGDGARHVLRHRLRAPSAELARKRAAGIRALLRPAGRRQQHAGLRGHSPGISSAPGRGSRQGCAWARRRCGAPTSRTARFSSSATSTTARPTRSRSSPRRFALKKAHIPVRIVPVMASPGNVRIFGVPVRLQLVHPAVGVPDDGERAGPADCQPRGPGP